MCSHTHTNTENENKSSNQFPCPVQLSPGPWLRCEGNEEGADTQTEKLGSSEVWALMELQLPLCLGYAPGRGLLVSEKVLAGQRAQAVNIQPKGAAVASLCTHWSIVNTCTWTRGSRLCQFWASPIWGKALPVSHGSEALVLGIAVSMPTTCVHSGLHPLRASQDPYSQQQETSSYTWSVGHWRNQGRTSF